MVLLGSGYDTRAIRYRDSRVRFFEVDLKSVVDVKAAHGPRLLPVEQRHSARARPRL